MNRISLRGQIEQYKPYDQAEMTSKQQFLRLLDEENCFHRERLEGHITASAWVVNLNRDKVLLLHHKKLDKWLQPGGHCDGDENTERVALKEVQEETGLTSIKSTGIIFDLDVHAIPEKKGVPAHKHFDIRYFFIAADPSELQKNDESNALQWVPFHLLKKYTTEPSIQRMLEKSN